METLMIEIELKFIFIVGIVHIEYSNDSEISYE